MVMWGGIIALFFQYLIQAGTIFDKKYNWMFAGVIASLVLCILEATFGIYYLYTASNSGSAESQLVWGTLFAFFWFTMIQAVTWLYVLRIQSLGKYMTFDKCVSYIPFFLAVFEVFTVVGIVLHASQIDKYKDVYLYTSVLFTIICIVLELLMTGILVRKLKFILEYREDLLQKIWIQIVVASAFVVVLECAIVVVKFTGTNIDFTMRPLAYIVRIYVIIQFYDELITGIQLSNSGSSEGPDAFISSAKKVQTFPEIDLTQAEIVSNIVTV